MELPTSYHTTFTSIDPKRKALRNLKHFHWVYSIVEIKEDDMRDTIERVCENMGVLQHAIISSHELYTAPAQNLSFLRPHMLLVEVP